MIETATWTGNEEIEAPTETAEASPAVRRLRLALPPDARARVRSASELVRSRAERETEPLRTAFPALDLLLDGGLPRGELVELVGRRSTGRFSLTLAALAAATGTGEAAALVDLGDHLDPEAAAAAGVDLDRLLWLRPLALDQALAGAEMLIAGGFPLVVLDLGLPPVRGGRGSEVFWLRLARAARDHRTALLVSTPYRATGTAAAAVLEADGVRASWRGADRSPGLLEGLAARLVLAKRRGRLPGQSAGLSLRVAESLPALPAAVTVPAGEAPAPRKARMAALPRAIAAVG